MQGNRTSNKEIMKYSKLFEDEITLENIAHDQLKAICRLLMISPIGTSNFLRFKIRLKLQELKADDQVCFFIQHLKLILFKISQKFNFFHLCIQLLTVLNFTMIKMVISKRYYEMYETDNIIIILQN